MRAAVFRGKGSFSIEEKSLSKLKEEWVRIKVEAAGICGSDVNILRRGYRRTNGDMEGQILGHENAGEIVEVGGRVSSIRKGKRVAVAPHSTCGKCSYCRSGFWVRCAEGRIIGYDFPGGFAEFMDVPEDTVFKIPDSICFNEASQIDSAACGVHAIAVGNCTPTGTVVVIGDGAIGLFSMQAALLSTPAKLILVGKHQRNLDLASKLGATATLNVNEVDPLEAVKDLTKGRGADVVIEAVGRKSNALEDAIQMASSGGRVVLAGVFTEPKPISLRRLLLNDIRIIPSAAYGYWGDRNEFRIAIDLVKDRRIKVEPLITHKLGLAKIEEAFHLLLNKGESGAIKIAILPQQ